MYSQYHATCKLGLKAYNYIQPMFDKLIGIFSKGSDFLYNLKCASWITDPFVFKNMGKRINFA